MVESSTSDADRAPRHERFLLAAGGAFAAWTLLTNTCVLLGWGLDALLWMALAAALLAIAGRRHLWPSRPAVPLTLADRVMLAIATLVGVAATLLWVDPDGDDSFYVSLALDAVHAPTRPLIRFDALHGIPELPIYLPVYRAHSFEMLAAAFARLTGTHPMFWLHLVFSTAGAVALVFAHAMLFRRLVPNHVMAAVLATVAVMLLVGGPHRWHSGFAFLRIHQGKGWLVSVMVPVLIALAFDFARRPERRTGLRLALAQVAAVGVSSTSLWLAPAVVGLTCLAAWSPRPTTMLWGGVVTSIHPLGWSALMWSEREVFQPATQANSTPSGWDRSLQAIQHVLGDGTLPYLVLACLAMAWIGTAPGPRRRVVLGLPILGALVFLCPLWVDFVADLIKLLWRSLWVVPLPAYIALAVTAPLGTGWRPAWGRIASTALLLLLALGFAPDERVLTGHEAYVRFAPFQLKVPLQYPQIRCFAEQVPKPAVALAPKHIAVWLATVEQKPFQLVVKKQFMKHHYARFGRGDTQYRQSLQLLTSAASSVASRRVLLRGIDTYDIRGVWLDPAARHPALDSALRTRGFAPAACKLRRGTAYVRTRVD